jgi:hypothetical protein
VDTFTSRTQNRETKNACLLPSSDIRLKRLQV